MAERNNNGPPKPMFKILQAILSFLKSPLGKKAVELATEEATKALQPKPKK